MNDFKNYDDVIIYNNSVKNSIIKLCASLGLIRFNNPEGGEISQSINYDLEDLLIKLDNYFGFKIDFPNNNVLPSSPLFVSPKKVFSLLERGKTNLPTPQRPRFPPNLSDCPSCR